MKLTIMLPSLPIQDPAIFIFCTIATLLLFYWVLKNSSLKPSTRNGIMIGLIIWLTVQGLVANSGFYSEGLDALPPRFVLAFGPFFLLMIVLFLTEKGRAFLDSLPLYEMTWLNIIRIPVEIGLFWLAVGGAIPEIMTFAGRNFDILAGISAPFVAYFGIKKRKIGRVGLLIWNVVMLVLLINIIVTAILAAPTPLQQLAFDNPNYGILFFPYNWLPAFIVPVVLLGHFASIRQLLRND
ncbi:MAG: hypothetical protein ACI85O_001742 [Saprospiraceae bacterium]|jgi:hypothetical protein